MLNRKITEMDCATSSSLAWITGAVAAMAEPPQIDEPTPIKMALFFFKRSALYSTKATMSEMEMVERMMGSDCFPLAKISERFMPKPSSTTAYCNTFLEVNATPLWHQSLRGITSVMTMPIRMANTGPPTTGSHCPSAQAGSAMKRHSAMPGAVRLIVSISRSQPF